VTVTSSEGLHARAVILVAELARSFESKVALVKGDERVEATEVLQILSLGAAEGERIAMEAVGSDAEEAIEALTQLFAGNFDENGGKTRETEASSN